MVDAQKATLLCPLEEILFWDWSDFSKPIPDQIIKYFFYKIKDAVNACQPVSSWVSHKENIHIIGTLFWEYLPENFETKINQIVDILSNNGIHFTFLINADYSHKFNNIPNVVFINYFLLRTYWYTQKYRNQEINRSWNHESKKGLFLTGKTNKIHRVGLLYSLYQRKVLMSDFMWSSFIKTEKIKKECNDIVKYYASSIDGLLYSDDLFGQFVEDTNGSAEDTIDVITGPEGHTFYSGFPYDLQLFSDTKYSVVSESYFSTSRVGGDNDAFPFITEKTWKTIVNNHPFVMVGMPNTNLYLEKLGFKVFDEFMQHPNYQAMTDDNVFRDPYKRLEVIVENIAEFASNLDDNKEIVSQYITHNTNHFSAIVDGELNKIMTFLSANNIRITINGFLSLINDTADDHNEYHILLAR